jgi:putative protease
MSSWIVPLSSGEQFSTVDWEQLLQQWKQVSVSHVILRPEATSRQGRYSWEEITEQLALVRKFNMVPIIEWDVLMEQGRFLEISTAVEQWLVSFEQLPIMRVQDFGALYWLKDRFPNIAIQLNLETGHRNLPAIEGMLDYVGAQLESVVLSFELTHDKLQEFKQVIDVPVEILFFGRIPLFYSPRKLLSATALGQKSKNREIIQLQGRSEESPHTGFPLLENRHGTFMFNVKELSLLDVYGELVEMGIDLCRIDLTQYDFAIQLDWMKKIERVVSLQVDYQDFKQQYPAPLVRGFYSANRSSILFEKLKNRHLLRSDETFVGEVVEVLKPKHIAVTVLRRGLKQGDAIFYISPEGKQVHTVVNRMLNSKGEEVENAQPGELVFLAYQKGLSTKSSLNLEPLKNME